MDRQVGKKASAPTLLIVVKHMTVGLHLKSRYDFKLDQKSMHCRSYGGLPTHFSARPSTLPQVGIRYQKDTVIVGAGRIQRPPLVT